MTSDNNHLITTIDGLEKIYGDVYPPAKAKETDRITPAYRKLIEAAPFFALASNGPGGLDCSPRGDPAGFVRVADEKTLLIPDRRGNNRIDTMRNIVHDPRVALLFLIPGCSETHPRDGPRRDLGRSGAGAAIRHGRQTSRDSTLSWSWSAFCCVGISSLKKPIAISTATRSSRKTSMRQLLN